MADKSVYVERLKNLVIVARDLDESQWDKTVWMAPDCERGDIVGWAACDPWFNQQGLTLVDIGNGDTLIPAYGNAKGFEACEQFFGLSPEIARDLFYVAIYQTRAETIAAIENYMKVISYE